ncbi:MAG: glycosyl hydrolase 108 family protein [Actinomycetota bacterium]
MMGRSPVQFDWRWLTWGCLGLLGVYILVPPVLENRAVAQVAHDALSAVEVGVDSATGKMVAVADRVGGSQVQAALKLILDSEGGCQNSWRDSGNRFQGQLGFTCMGVTPAVGWNHRDGIFKELGVGFSGHPAFFVKFVHDRNRDAFRRAAQRIFIEDYFAPGGCTHLAQPAFEICADIAVNSGVGRSRQYLREIGAISDAKSLARALNERHRQDYLRWSQKGADAGFRAGWLARASRRQRYIELF